MFLHFETEETPDKTYRRHEDKVEEGDSCRVWSRVYKNG